MKVNLFYLSGNTTGGWVTYTSHMCKGLKGFSLFKVGNRTETKSRPFGYGLDYVNLSLDDAVRQVHSGPSLIVALQKNWREKAEKLIDAGAWTVIHDPAEFKHFDMKVVGPRSITIRKAVHSQVRGSHLLLHPYQRHYQEGTLATREIRACSISRIDFDKRTDILLDANRLLPPGLRIDIHGFENRIYTRFKLCPKYPEWEQSVAHYAREDRRAADICHSSWYSVDMSVIKGDGGGTQYTFLESMDAGSVNVINSQWIIPGDEMVPYPRPSANCVTAGNGQELAAVLRSNDVLGTCDNIVRAGESLMRNHRAEVIAQELLDLLSKG